MLALTHQCYPYTGTCGQIKKTKSANIILRNTNTSTHNIQAHKQIMQIINVVHLYTLLKKTTD